MKQKTVWTERFDSVTLEISLHAVGEDYTPRGKGIYCYYIYIYESQVTPEQFAELWLEDKVIKITEESKGFVTHDYYQLPILKAVDFAGGITFYAKHGYTPGFRSVRLGCDYNHSWDEDNPPSFARVESEAKATVNQVLAYLSTPTS